MASDEKRLVVIGERWGKKSKKTAMVFDEKEGKEKTLVSMAENQDHTYQMSVLYEEKIDELKEEEKPADTEDIETTKCPDCNSKKLKELGTTTNNQVLYECLSCGKEFKWGTLNRRKNEHTVYVDCPSCGYEYAEEHNEKDKSYDGGEIYCPKCDEVF